MSDYDDVRREFERESASEQRAIASSWESFLSFAARVIRVTADMLDILMNLYRMLKRRY